MGVEGVVCEEVEVEVCGGCGAGDEGVEGEVGCGAMVSGDEVLGINVFQVREGRGYGLGVRVVCVHCGEGEGAEDTELDGQWRMWGVPKFEVTCF